MSFAEFSKYLLKVLNWLRNIRSICYIGVYFVCVSDSYKDLCALTLCPLFTSAGYNHETNNDNRDKKVAPVASTEPCGKPF